MARTGIRASAIIVKDNQILLVHRRKEGREYWVLPGGGIEEGEAGEEAIKREVKEETGLSCKEIKLAFKTQTYKGGNEHPFYFCETEEGKVKLGGPEAKKHSKDNWYQLEWIELKQIPAINLVPESVKNKLIQLFPQKNGELLSCEEAKQIGQHDIIEQ